MTDFFDNLLSELSSAGSPDERARVTLRFNLKMQKPKIQRAILVAAVPNWFDKKTIEDLLGEDLSDDEFKDFLSLPYVEVFINRGWNIHEKTKEILRSELWESNKAYFQKISRKLAVRYRKFHSSESIYKVDCIYHSLMSDEKKSIDIFTSTLGNWFNRFEYLISEALLNSIQSSVDAGRLTGIALTYFKYFKGRIENVNGNFANAKRYIISAIEDNINRPLFKANCYHILGDVLLKLSELDEAKKALLEAIELYRSLSDRPGTANCLLTLGSLERRIDKLDSALSFYLEARKIYRDINMGLGAANCDVGIATIYLTLGIFEKADQNFRSALAVFTKFVSILGMSTANRGIGDVYFHMHEYDQAKTYYLEAMKGLGNSSGRLSYANCLISMGILKFDLCEISAAKNFLKLALEIFVRIQELIGQIGCHRAMGQIYLSEGLIAEARQCFSAALNIARGAEDQMSAAYVIICSGHLEMDVGNFDQANIFFEDALSIFKALNLPAGQADALRAIGKLHRKQKLYDSSIEKFNKSLEALDETDSYIYRSKSNLFNGTIELSVADAVIAISKSPNYAAARVNMIQINIFKEDLFSAAENLAIAKVAAPEDYHVSLWEAIIFALKKTEWENQLLASLQKFQLPEYVDDIIRDIDLVLSRYDESIVFNIRGHIERHLFNITGNNTS